MYNIQYVLAEVFGGSLISYGYLSKYMEGQNSRLLFMKEYIKEFDEVTYTFTEKDLSTPFLSVLNDLKEDIIKAKKKMGIRYTEEVDNKVQSLLDTYIISSFKFQVDVRNHLLRWSKDVTTQNAMHHATSIGNFANDHIRQCKILQNDISTKLNEIGVPICKQVIW